MIELNYSVTIPIRRKILKWFQNDLKMTPDGLLNRLGGNHIQYWSNFLNGSKPYAKYKGYMKMAEAYGVTEDQFIRKMEEFIREDLGGSQNVNEDLPYSLHSKIKNLSPGQQKIVDLFVSEIAKNES